MFSKFAKRDGDGNSGPSGRKKGTVYGHESGAAKRKKAAFLSAANDPKQSKLSFTTTNKNKSTPRGSQPSVSDEKEELSDNEIVNSAVAAISSDGDANDNDEKVGTALHGNDIGEMPQFSSAPFEGGAGHTEEAECIAPDPTSPSACVDSPRAPVPEPDDIYATSTSTAEESFSASASPSACIDSPRSPLDCSAAPTPPSNEPSRTEVRSNITFETRHIPDNKFKFPKSDGGRSCQLKWFDTYKCLHYVEGQDHVVCFTCFQAQRLGRPATGRGNEETFAQTGFRWWRKAVEKFQVHQCSKYHLERVCTKNIRKA